MKKIFSLLVIVSIISSMFVTAYAETATLTISEPIPVEDTVYNEDIAEDGVVVPDGYTAYQVNFSLSGVGEIAGTSKSAIVGRQITNFTIALSFDDVTNINKELYRYSWNSSLEPDTDTWSDAEPTKYTMAIAASPYPGKAKETVTDDGNIEDAFIMYFIIKDGCQATASIVTSGDGKSGLAIGNYSSGVSNDVTAYDLTYSKTSFTIGSAGGETGKVTTIDADKQTVGKQDDESVKTYESTDGTQKYLKHIATVLDGAAANKTVTINKVNAEGNVLDSKVSGRTLAQIFYGVTTENTTISGNLAIGVLTSNVDDIFKFVLVDAE